MDNVESKVKELVGKYSKVESGYVYADSDDLVYDLGLDSLSLVEFLMDLEETFNIEIPEEDITNIYKYGKLITYIEKTTK